MVGTKQSKSAKQAPVSAHPAFPAVVALWFAALLGLGSLVLPVIIFEKFVVATGISGIWEAASPPLGITARLAIALCCALFGVIAGLVIARKVANAQTQGKARPTSKTQRSDDQANTGFAKRMPISAHDELGSDSLDEPVERIKPHTENYGGRRRALAVTDDSGPSDFFESAPLPGGNVLIDAHDSEDAQSDVFDHAEPLDLAELALDDEADLEFAANSDAANTSAPPPHVPRPFDGPMHSDTYAQPVRLTGNDADYPHKEPAPMSSHPDSLGSVYNPFQNPAAAPNTAPRPFEQPASIAPAFPAEAAPQTAPLSMPHSPAAQTGHPAAPIGERALNELGIAELVERFAAALQAKAAAPQHIAPAEPVEPAPAATAAPSPQFDDQPAPMVFRRAGAAESNPAPAFSGYTASEPAVAAMTNLEVPQTMATALPAALQPLSFADLDSHHDEEDDHFPDLTLSFSHTVRNFQNPAPVPHHGDAQSAAPQGFVANWEAEADPGDNPAYSSLLSIKSPLSSGQEFVRIDDDMDVEETAEPVVIFPGQKDNPAAREMPESSPFAALQQGIEDTVITRPFDSPNVSAAPTRPAASNINAYDQPTNSSETERALREALEKLQRMSGAA